MKKFLYVYILRCSDESYYVGVTNNPELRLKEHNSGYNTKAFTFSRRPVEMVYCERFSDYFLAISWEKKLQKWSRKKKEALIAGDIDSLRMAASCKNDSHYSNKDLV